MLTRKERRKIAKQQARLERAGANHVKWLYAGGGLAAVAVVMGGLGYLWQRGSLARSVASTGSPLGVTAPSGKPGEKSLKEIEAEVAKKDFEQRKAKEWVWGEEGHTELSIEAYRNIIKKGSHAHEDRVRVLNSLARTIKPRKQWPKGFSDEKANQVLDFLSSILKEKHDPGSDGLSAINVLIAYALAIPEYRKKAERDILAYYGADDRPGPRAACLDALSKFQSPEAIQPLKRAVKSEEYSTSRTALYSLANYLGSPVEAEPRKVMLEIARNNPQLRPLAAKLLAYHGNRSVASIVPILLGKGAGPAEVEAGAYVIEQLKLKEYRGLLQGQAADSPFLQQQIDAASKATDK